MLAPTLMRYLSTSALFSSAAAAIGLKPLSFRASLSAPALSSIFTHAHTIIWDVFMEECT